MESFELPDGNVVIEYLEEVSFNVKSKTRVSDLFFAEAIQKCGSVFFQKKQTPQMKELRKHAMTEIMYYILVQKNITLSEDQIYKKINNMKTRVKAKREQQSGNKEIKLNEGEKIILHLMDSVEKSTTPTASDEKLGVGDEVRLADDDSSPTQSKRAKLSHSINHKNNASSHLLTTSVTTKGKPHESDQQSSQFDRSKLDVSELEKMVLMKKLDVLEAKKTLYEKAHNVLDIFQEKFLK